MGQDHKFILISYEEYEEKGHDGYYPINENLSDIIIIHDDIIQYIRDTLAWIPSINPCNNYKIQKKLYQVVILYFILVYKRIRILVLKKD